MGGGRGERRDRWCGRCGGGCGWLEIDFVGVCEAGKWLKDASGGFGSVVVVLVVMVERRARRGRRKVGGSMGRGVDGWQSVLPMPRANMLATRLIRCDTDSNKCGIV